MKNNSTIFLILFFLFINLNLAAQEINISSTKMQYDNIDKITIFEGSVSSEDQK